MLDITWCQQVAAVSEGLLPGQCEGTGYWFVPHWAIIDQATGWWEGWQGLTSLDSYPHHHCMMGARTRHAWESARSRLLVMECRKGDGGGGGKASVLQWALPSPV